MSEDKLSFPYLSLLQMKLAVLNFSLPLHGYIVPRSCKRRCVSTPNSTDEFGSCASLFPGRHSDLNSLSIPGDVADRAPSLRTLERAESPASRELHVRAPVWWRRRPQCAKSPVPYRPAPPDLTRARSSNPGHRRSRLRAPRILHSLRSGFQLARLPSIAIWYRSGSITRAPAPSGRMTHTGRLSAGFFA